MSRHLCLAVVACAALCCQAQPPRTPARLEAEYYVAVYARHYGVPIALVQAIVQQESGWQACAVSRKGAVGLMQLMPEVAQQFGVDPYDPKQNVQAGSKYLKQLITRYKGDTKLALAAYNAGPAVVDAAGGVPAIPETTAFVGAILKEIGSNAPASRP